METTQQSSQVPVRKGLAITALVLGITSLITPLVGPLLGIAAIIFAIVALTRRPAQSKGLAITGLVTGIFGIIIGSLLLFLFSYFIVGNTPAQAERDKVVQHQLDERKQFTMNETAIMGNIDFAVTSVERGYKPTAQEKKGSNPTEAQSNEDVFRGRYGKAISESDAEYILVTADTKNNGSRDLGSGTLGLVNMRLNKVEPMDFSSTNKEGTSIRGAIPESVRYVYRIREGSTDLKLQYYCYIDTHVNPIFGTEGAAQAELVYTIILK